MATSVKPRVTLVQRNQFLEHVRDGLNRAEAAAKIGLTGSKMRALCRHDQAFQSLYEQALADGKHGFQDTVRQSWHTRALEGKNDRLLWYLVVSTLPEAAWFRNGTAAADETGEHRHDLTRLTNEELVQLKQIVAKSQDPADSTGRRGLRAVGSTDRR